jgi:hypothetical protein
VAEQHQDRLREFIEICEQATERDFEAREIATPYALARIALALEAILEAFEVRTSRTSALEGR